MLTKRENSLSPYIKITIKKQVSEFLGQFLTLLVFTTTNTTTLIQSCSVLPVLDFIFFFLILL